MICHCGIDHDAELNQSSELVDTGGRDYLVSVHGNRFVHVSRWRDEPMVSLWHVEDRSMATRFTLYEGKATMAKWGDPDRSKIVFVG